MHLIDGAEDLSEQACVELLASTTVGRVTLSVGALPAILPVSYQYLANDILISIPDGPARRSAAHGNVIALEVDNGDFTDVFWTVLVIGRAADHTTSRPGTYNLHLRPDIITGYRAPALNNPPHNTPQLRGHARHKTDHPGRSALEMSLPIARCVCGVLAADDCLDVDDAVVVEFEKLASGWLAGVGVMGVASVTKLTERRWCAEIANAVSGGFESLVHVTGQDGTDRTGAQHAQQTVALDDPALLLWARRDRRMMHTQQDVGACLTEILAELIEGRRRNRSGVVAHPLRIEQPQRPVLRQRNDTKVVDLTDNRGHDIGIVVVSCEEIATVCMSVSHCLREPIRLRRPVGGNVAGEDHDIDMPKKGIQHRREARSRVMTPHRPSRIADEMHIAQLCNEHQLSLPHHEPPPHAPKPRSAVTWKSISSTARSDGADAWTSCGNAGVCKRSVKCGRARTDMNKRSALMSATATSCASTWS